MSLPRAKRRPVHVEFDFNDLHVTGDLLAGKDHAYKVEAVIDAHGKRHRLSHDESKAILRKINKLCAITAFGHHKKQTRHEAMHMATQHGFVHGHLLAKVERPD